MNENCPYNDECGILASCNETCCRVKELFDDYYRLEKLYFEKEAKNVELKKQLQQSTKDFYKSCAEDCALENTKMIQKLKRLLDNEKHCRYQAETKLEKLKPILEQYADTKAGEKMPDDTYRVELQPRKYSDAVWGESIYGRSEIVRPENYPYYDPRPAKEGLEIMEADIMEKNKKLEGVLYEKLLELVSPRLLTDSCGYNEETHSFDIILALKEILEYLENEK